MQLKNIFIHHVFFWLKEKDNKEHLQQLIEGLEKLTAIKTIKQYHIGVPADTNRDVVENTYSVSWLLFFENKDDEESYQTDSIHLAFVKNCSMLWKRVVVHDSVDA